MDITKQNKMDELPRRIQLEKMVPAEKAIYECGLMIEKMGADERLTNAQNKLREARELVADFVDITFEGNTRF